MKNKNQIEKFKAAAKEAECDLDEAAFDKALGKLAKVEKPIELDEKDEKTQDSNE